MTLSRRFLIAALMLLMAGSAFGQSREELRSGRQKDWNPVQVQKWVDYWTVQPNIQQALNCDDFTNRRDAIMNGNRITTQILNFGSISSPGNTITDIVWNGLGYGYEFGPFVAAEIVDVGHKDPQSVLKRDENGAVVRTAEGDSVWVMHIVSDGLVSNGGEVSPDGTEYWGWQPSACALPVGNFPGIEVVSQESRLIPTSDAPDKNLDGKPDSWPDSWFNPILKEFVWPGALQQGASNADKETLYFMNDYANKEFHYYPFPSDSTRRGLGLEVETRVYQWANALTEDAMFLIYKITNKSEKDLDNVIFGMWGDPHIGGPNNWPDDLAFFDKDLNMVFAWDSDGRSDIPNRPPGYFGYTYLESPGLGNEIIDGVFYPGDGIDNDGDGMLDESWTDGIDNDNDWDPETDDVGIDGIPGTGDPGEGDGIPTAGDQFDITKPGEPNFEFTDIDESDMIGLTSFTSPGFAGNRISNDERVWSLVQPGTFDSVPPDPGDYVFLYGSGSFPLRAGETKRFSIALIVGENLADLRLNAQTVQQIFKVGYRFARPPDKPRIRAVPGDRKVTLYWDDRAELSVDPLSRTRDFEGYTIYRSTDYGFSDQQTITDINGSKFLFKPLTTSVGVDARFDLDNGIKGPSEIVFPQRGVAYNLGADTGLFHTFVDSNNVVNGQTYYYAVGAYDRGYAPQIGTDFGDGIPPSETSKTITYNPVDDSYIFDVNTVSVIPRPEVAGYVAPVLGDENGRKLVQEAGTGTGALKLKVLEPLLVPNGGRYVLSFDESGTRIRYSVRDEIPDTSMVRTILGKASGTGIRNIIPETFTLKNSSGQTLQEGVDYLLNPESGTVEMLRGTEGEILTAVFNHFALYQSEKLAGEESNPIFDGMQLFVTDDELMINEEETGWTTGGNGLGFDVRVANSGPGRVAQPADYEIRFEGTNVTTAFSTNLPLPFRILNLTKANQQIEAFVPDINRDGAWNLAEPVVFVETLNGVITATWQVTFDAAGPRPGAGDVFYLRTRKPFTKEDRFVIETRGATTDVELEKSELSDIYVVPNPYVATNELEPRNPVSNTQRGDRRLYFANVPAKCTVRIYTLAGELIDTLEHNSTVDDGKLFWDLRTRDNMNIAYGLYIYHVESESGTFVGKFAVIK